MIINNFLKNGEIYSIQYFGDDLEKFQAVDDIKQCILNHMYKECETDDGHKGVIIGIEDNKTYSDYYYIVWVPQIEKIYYELVLGCRYINNN